MFPRPVLAIQNWSAISDTEFRPIRAARFDINALFLTFTCDSGDCIFFALFVGAFGSIGLVVGGA